MNIKDRFTVAVTIGDYGRKDVRGIYDHKTKEYITEKEFDIICQKEYGEYLAARNAVAEKTVELIVAEMKFYNLTCEKGFEITIEDIINKFKQNKNGNSLRAIAESGTI